MIKYLICEKNSKIAVVESCLSEGVDRIDQFLIIEDTSTAELLYRCEQHSITVEYYILFNANIVHCDAEYKSINNIKMFGSDKDVLNKVELLIAIKNGKFTNELLYNHYPNYKRENVEHFNYRTSVWSSCDYTKVKFAFFGDSITEGNDSENNMINSVNFGVGSDTSIDMLLNVEYTLNNLLDLEMAHILIGVNDWRIYRYGYDVWDTYFNIIALKLLILSKFSNCRIFISNVYMQDQSRIEYVTSENIQMKQLNKLLKNIKGVLNIKTDINFYNETGNLRLDISDDGLHLNDEGYKIFWENLYEYVN